MYKSTSNLFLKLTISQLLLSNVHIGHTKRFLDIKIKPYLLGARNDLHILNIMNTTFQFKVLINIIVNLISLRHQILIVKDRDLFNFRSLLNLKNVYFSDKKWIGGSLTNFKRVRLGKNFKADNLFYNGLGSLRYMPSLVFFFDVNISKWAVIESSNLEIPISAVIDSNSHILSHINYPILGNNQSFEALFLYLNLIINSVIRGQQKELLKILRIV